MINFIFHPRPRSGSGGLVGQSWLPAVPGEIQRLSIGFLLFFFCLFFKQTLPNVELELNHLEIKNCMPYPLNRPGAQLSPLRGGVGAHTRCRRV